MKKIFIPLFVFLLAFVSNAQTELSDDDAESKLLVNDDKLIVLDFYATWCGPCKRMDSIIKELTNEYSGEVNFYKIDVDKSQVDDALGIAAMPTYLFIKNSENLEQIEGAMSKTRMKGLIDKHLGDGTSTSIVNDEFDYNDSFEFNQETVDKIWDSSSKLNSFAWKAYLESDNVKELLLAMKAVERSIELETNYYNTDTHAALLYKTGNYSKALKKAKEAIDIAKNEGLAYSTTTELIEKIIDEM